jgi:FkbM family methyltransferase
VPALREPLSLVDVGASGGIAPYWRIFEPHLLAVGFDPLLGEVQRLNASEPNSHIRYHAALVGYSRYREMLPSHPVPSLDAITRSSSARALKLMSLNYTQTYFDHTHDGTTATESIDLDTFFVDNVDVIKIDTDGHDYEVLLGAKALLQRAPVIGLLVEAQFLGLVHKSTSQFSNMDLFLRNLGFSLFDIAPRRYSRGVLPLPFWWNLPASTHGGQVIWADCLYFRDVALPGYEQDWRVAFDDQKLLKLVCLYDLFCYPDCAAELLLTFRDRFSAYLDVPGCLDLLTPPLPDGRTVPYREYLAAFDADPTAFYSGKGD